MKKEIVFPLVLIVVLFLVVGCTTVKTKTIPATEVNPVDPLQALQTIGKCTWGLKKTYLPTRVDITGKVTDCEGVFPIYEWYIIRLTKEVIEQVDPGPIESAYRKWKENKDLEVVGELIKWTFGLGISNKWTRFIDDFIKSCHKVTEDKHLYSRALQGSQDDIKQIKATYWKCKFIEPQHMNLLYSRGYVKEFPFKRIAEIASYLSGMIASIDEKIKKDKEEEIRKQELAIAEQRRKEYEEQRRIEAEEAERKRIEEEKRLRETYGVTAKLTPFELCSNPFKYEGKTVVIFLIFKRMMEKTVGVFGYPGSDCEILVSKLPSDLFTMTGQTAKLIVRVRGTTEVVNRLGVSFRVPHVEYIAF